MHAPHPRISCAAYFAGPSYLKPDALSLCKYASFTCVTDGERRDVLLFRLTFLLRINSELQQLSRTDSVVLKDQEMFLSFG